MSDNSEDYGEETSENDFSHCEESETAEEERQIQESSEGMKIEIGAKLEAALNQIKATTKTLLGEMDIYMQEMESIQIDYIRCHASQRKENLRLEEVQPDVTSTAAQILEQFSGINYNKGC